MRIDRVVVGSLDFGVGVLRGATFHAALPQLHDNPQVEAAIENIRRAARIIEHLQRTEARRARPRRRARRRR